MISILQNDLAAVDGAVDIRTLFRTTGAHFIFMLLYIVIETESGHFRRDSAWKRSSKPAWNLPMPNVQ